MSQSCERSANTLARCCSSSLRPHAARLVSFCRSGMIVGFHGNQAELKCSVLHDLHGAHRDAPKPVTLYCSG